MRIKTAVGLLIVVLAGCGDPDRGTDTDPIEGDDAGATGGDTGGTGGSGASSGVGMTGGTGAPTTGGVSTGGSSGGSTGASTGMATGGSTGMATGGSTGMMTGGSSGGTTAGTTGGEVPMGAYCDPVANWMPEWVAFEDEVLRLTNEARAVGHNCDAEGDMPATTPLTLDPRLRCSARVHSKYMADVGDDFAHTTKAGVTPGNRMQMAGYSGGGGENIAVGQRTPADVVAGWLDSDGHCANIMNSRYKVLGVGYAYGLWNGRMAPYWTQNFGSR